MSDPTIGGHPSEDLVTDTGRTFTITVCENCGQIRTVLFLTGDRWYCTGCRQGGDARPTMIPLGGRK